MVLGLGQETPGNDSLTEGVPLQALQNKGRGGRGLGFGVWGSGFRV